MKKRMEVLSVCFDEETMQKISELTESGNYRSKGELVRECVKKRVDELLKRKHIKNKNLG